VIDTVLGTVRVWFDDQPAPLLYVSPTQINLVVPYTISGRSSVRMQLENNGVRFPAPDVTVAESAPAIFTAGGSAAVLNQDATLNTPQNAASPGSIVVIYATGEGLVTPVLVTGTINPPSSLPKPVLPVRIFIGGREAEVLYAGAAPGQVTGLLQVNARLPLDTPANSSVPIVLAVGSGRSQDNLNISIGNEKLDNNKINI